MNRRRTNSKKIDKQMDKLKAEFRKNHMVMKKQKSSMAKSKSAGRFVSSLQDPEAWLSAFVTFIIYATHGNSGKVKKTLIKMLSEDYSPELWRNVEPIIDSLMEMEGYDQQIEEFPTQLWIEMEPILFELMDLDSPKLSVMTLNEEVRRVSKGEKVSPSVNGPTKDKILKRFYDLYSKFLSKLEEYQITDPSKIEKFLIAMIQKIHMVKINNKEDNVSRLKKR